MVDNKIKYSTAFTAGALLLRETEAFINEINDFEAFLSGNENIDSNVIPVNAESSKKRLKNEQRIYWRQMKSLKKFQLLMN